MTSSLEGIMRGAEECIVLVDEEGRCVGTAPKLASHSTATPLHLAFSCYLFDEDRRLLVTRRSWRKKTWPGVWTNTCCGHPLPGEELRPAVVRRLRAELGMTPDGIDVVIPRLRYRAVMDNGVVENEIGPVVRASSRTRPAPVPDEVAEIAWVPWQQFALDVLDGSRNVSPWAVLTIRRLHELDPDPWQWPVHGLEALPPALHGTA